MGFPDSSAVKNPPAMQDMQETQVQKKIPGLGKSPEGRHGNPLQYPCLKNPRNTFETDENATWLSTSPLPLPTEKRGKESFVKDFCSADWMVAL